MKTIKGGIDKGPSKLNKEKGEKHSVVKASHSGFFVETKHETGLARKRKVCWEKKVSRGDRVRFVAERRKKERRGGEACSVKKCMDTPGAGGGWGGRRSGNSPDRRKKACGRSGRN